MVFTRRTFASLAFALPLFLAACAGPAPHGDTQARAALAPAGTLRVGVYPGSPTSLVRDPKTGSAAGIAHDLGEVLGHELGVPVKIVEFSRVAQVLEALKANEVDFTFTNATESRARDVDFTQPLVMLELGYLVPPGSAIASIADVDKPGVRVGVTQGSTSQGTLGRQFKQAAIVPAPSLEKAAEMLRQRGLDTFATNKGILFEMSDQVPGSRVLDGRWGLEHMAIAIPKGRDAGMPFLRQFGDRMRVSGRLQAIVVRAGLRGTASE
ncbi:MAG: transporter substrate-binding domain-containing protein [Ramlibacter sp.]